MRKTFGLLPLDVGRAHVDDAGQAEARRDGGRGDAVLAGAGLGDDARLAHALGQQDLAEAVVDLVRAGVVQLLALEIDLRAAEMLGQPLGEIERARPAGIVLSRCVELGLEGRVVLGLVPVRARGRGSAASAFRRRNGRRTCRTCPARRVRCGRNWARPACSCVPIVPDSLSLGAATLCLQAESNCRLVRPRCSPRGAHGPEKGFDQRRILDARRAFDARRDVDAGRVGEPTAPRRYCRR